MGRRRRGLPWIAVAALLALPACRLRPRDRVAEGAIDEAHAAQRSAVWVEDEGTVERLLRDDLEGSRHQQWILRIRSGLTLKFAHNIDLAPRVPLDQGDTIRFRGRYEYTDKGGTVHWTHHDPSRIEGGWIEHGGRRYE